MADLYIPGNPSIDEAIEYFGAEAMKQVQTLVSRPEFTHVRLMRDGHLGYQSMPIGGVTVSHRYIAPGGAGFDIGCGNWAGKTEVHMSYLTRGDLYELGIEISKKIAIGLGQAYGTFADHPLLPDIIHAVKDAHINITPEVIINQFGSVGAGNHYIDLMTDSEGYIWIALHYGSRKLGHTIADHYLKMLGANDGMFSMPVFLDTWSMVGQEYLRLMELAGEYARVSRRLVGTKIATQILQDTVVDVVENHHNYIWQEVHHGEAVYVTRKGATPVHPGVRAFIGGSMGTDSIIVEAIDCDENNKTFRSAMHGAGRTISRGMAKGKFTRSGEMKRAPLVTKEMMNGWMNTEGIIRIGGGVDESPHCYRNLIEDVLPYYPHLKVKEILSPVVVIMNPDEH